MITIQVKIENESYSNIFADLIANFPFINSVEIPELEKTFHSISAFSETPLVQEAKQHDDPSKFFGLWAKKDIGDTKSFREQLWQRKM